MLIDIDSEKVIDRIPGRREFDILRGRLSEAEFDAMVARVDELIDEAGAEIATAGSLPGSDWRGTPFRPRAWTEERQADAPTWPACRSGSRFTAAGLG